MSATASSPSDNATSSSAEAAQLTSQLLNDRDFLMDLNKDIVRKALDHWTGVDRLSQDEADDLFGDNYAVGQVFGKIRNLQGGFLLLQLRLMSCLDLLGGEDGMLPLNKLITSA